MLKVAYNEYYAHPLPEGHRFPMDKYRLLPEQLRYEGTLSDQNFFEPERASEARILRIHCPQYLKRLKEQKLSKKDERASGFPLSERLVERELYITGGSIQAVDFALQHGVAGNIAGGTHHAFRDRPEGFCLLNDIAVASAYALAEKRIRRILVVDLDVHQGNGTAHIFRGEERVFTFSMHGARNYPLHKEQSDLDIGLPDGCGDDEYLGTLEHHLPGLIELQRPQLIFFQSGVDVLGTDKLGRLKLSLGACRERDAMVFGRAYGAGIPVVFNMGGGYSERLAHIVDAHANTFRTAQSVYF